MDAPGVAPAPASPPPKRPAGSFPENHYSPGKLYTQFRIADGKSPLAWRKTKVFQADASPGSATGADATSPFAARAPVSRRLDTSGGVGADGERTPARLVQPSYEDKLFRANVPASRLLQRLQANKSLPLLMRKRARAVVQRRLLELVQPAEARCENELNALHAAATASRELPRDDDLPALEQKFAKEIAARAAFCLAKGAKAKVLKASGGARQPGASAASAKGSSSLKRKQPADKEAEQPPAVPVSGGVSKTSGRQIYLPARLREPPLADKQHGRRTPSSAAREAGVDGAALTGSVSTGLKGLKSGAVPRIKTAGFKPSKVRTRAGAHARGVARSPSARASYAGPWPCTVPPPPPLLPPAPPSPPFPSSPLPCLLLLQDGPELANGGSLLISPGGTPFSPGGHLRDRHDVRIGPSFQAELPDGAQQHAHTERADTLLWVPPPPASRTRAGGPLAGSANADVRSASDVDAFLERMGVRQPRTMAVAGRLPRAQPHGHGSPFAHGVGSGGTPNSTSAALCAALNDSDSTAIGGLTQERCLQCLLGHGYDSVAASAALSPDDHAVVTWNKVRASGAARAAFKAPHPIPSREPIS